MKTLRKLLLDEIAGRFASETLLGQGMQMVADAATCIHLQKLVRRHMRETEGHVAKLGKIFRAFGEEPVERTCEITKSLLKECRRTASDFKGSPAINAALDCAAQKIKHHEIASYRCLHEWAVLLGNKEAAGLLEEILDAEKAASRSLIKLARFRCNNEALGSGGADGSSCDVYGHKIEKTAA